MTDLTLAKDLLLVLAVAFLGGILAKRARQPLLVGYIIAGVVAGSLAGWFKITAELSTLAEIGIAFLMFTLGIEFSFKRLTRVRTVAVFGGMTQILATIILGLLIFPRFGFDFYSSLFLAAVFSLSSTAVVVKILADRGEIDSLPGEIMVGWLLVQDLAVLPMMVILPSLIQVNGGSWLIVVSAIAKAIILLYLIILLGKKVVPWVLEKIAATNSRELLLLSVVAMCLLAAFGTLALGLSFALGAFFAGLLVSASSENHAVFAEVRPLRDVFSIVFFVSLGMLLNISFLISHFPVILSLSLLVMFLKFLLVLVLVLYLGYHTKLAFLVGVGLIQVGEFSFILARMGIREGIIKEDLYATILSVAILTIIFTPFSFGLAPKVYLASKKWTHQHLPRIYSFVFGRFDRRESAESLPISGHVVICGHGRVGKHISRVLEMANIPYVVIDYNQKVVSDLKNQGVDIIYGDPGELEVLDYAQVDKAKVVVIAIPDRHSQELIIKNSLRLNKDVAIICRSHFEEDKERLLASGASLVVQPEFEAGLSLAHRILALMGKENLEILSFLKQVKKEQG